MGRQIWFVLKYERSLLHLNGIAISPKASAPALTKRDIAKITPC
jgi:hypothetical protein